MSEKWPSQKEEEIPITQIEWEKDSNTLEKRLQNKIPNDEEKYKQLLDIFTNIKEQKLFTEEEIEKYIEETNINLLWRKLGKSWEDQEKIIIESIDISLGKIIKAQETTERKIKIDEEVINTTTEVINTTTEVVNTTTEVVNTTTEVVNTTTEVVNTTTEVVNTTTEVVKETIDKEKRIESRKATQKSYDNLDKKNQITDEQLQEQKVSVPQIVIDAVNKKTQGTDLKSDDFLKFYLLGENKANKDKAEFQDFMKNYTELKKDLEIPEITSFRAASNPENTDRIIENNKGLRDFTQTSDKFNNISLPILPENKNFDEEFSMYVKLIPDEKIRKNIEENKTIIKEFKELYDKDQEDARNEKGQQAYAEYIDAIDTIKEDLPKKTQKIIKNRVLWSCITGLAKYFDTTTLNKDNFTDDFDINTQEGYEIQNDDTLYINGNIKGKSIGFYYNLTDKNAQLQSDDFLHFDKVAETFILGKNKEGLSASGGKNNLGIQLPTVATLSLQAQRVSEDNFVTALEDAASLEEFEKNIKDNISNKLLQNYNQEALIKTRVERDIEKNMTTQTLQNKFLPDLVLNELNRDKMTDKTTEATPRKIMEIRDKTTENMRSDELRTCRTLIEKLDPLISREDHGKLEPKRKKLLEGIEEERGEQGWKESYKQRGEHTLKFFKKFSKNWKMNLQDLDVFIKKLEKKEDIAMNSSKFSPDFQAEEENENADSLVENLA
jgi:hypothetical protein